MGLGEEIDKRCMNRADFTKVNFSKGIKIVKEFYTKLFKRVQEKEKENKLKVQKSKKKKS